MVGGPSCVGFDVFYFNEFVMKKNSIIIYTCFNYDNISFSTNKNISLSSFQPPPSTNHV